MTPKAPATLLKRKSNTGIFLWILRILYIQKQPPEVLYNKGVLRNLAKFTGKQLCQSFFFNKETLTQVFSCEFCEISRNNFFYRTPLVAASSNQFYFSWWFQREQKFNNSLKFVYIRLNLLKLWWQFFSCQSFSIVARGFLTSYLFYGDPLILLTPALFVTLFLWLNVSSRHVQCVILLNDFMELNLLIPLLP